MRFVVITGPSGAGKTLALHSFEDAGYYAADNIPPRLLPGLIAFCRQEGRELGVAVTDTRCGAAFNELPAVLQELNKGGCEVELLFLDAGDDVLVQRYKETRRPHPIFDELSEGAQDGGIMEAIALERARLETARAVADHILDTSAFTATQLRETIHASYAQATRPGLRVTVTSFGFKHGLPIDADLVFDVRFLANPHYVAALKNLDGRDPRVAGYVHADPRTATFETKMEDLVGFALPQYEQEGKAYLNIAIGCTGGRHRSVVLAEDLADRLREDGYRVSLRHRDIPSESATSISPQEEDELEPPGSDDCLPGKPARTPEAARRFSGVPR
jgi:UPF0042 nucleotide-binding protein